MTMEAPAHLNQVRREIADLRNQVAKLSVHGQPGIPRNPRLALTVPDYLASPNYPLDPGDSGPTPNTYPFIFVDGQFTEVSGIQSVLVDPRSDVPIGRFRNLADAYIPASSLVMVFEDRGQFWASVSKGGTGQPPAIPRQRQWHLRFSVGDEPLTSSYSQVDFSWRKPSDDAPDMFLEWDDANKRINALGTIEVMILANLWIVVNDSSGFQNTDWFRADLTLRHFDQSIAHTGTWNKPSAHQNMVGSALAGPRAFASDIEYFSLEAGDWISCSIGLSTSSGLSGQEFEVLEAELLISQVII